MRITFLRISDLGFITKTNYSLKGFKVMLGGGVGSQPRHADELYAFLAAREIIPMMEAVIRLFYKYGERKGRAKARLKFQLKNLGLENFRALVIAITDKPEINMMVYNDCRSRH